MRAKGSTNILDGLMWGWRLLSPEEPFTEGRPYSDPENSKCLILMTDGENNHQAAANHNKSIYHAFGYASNGRLGATATSAALIGQMNNKTRAACENAKAAGITVYTIAFRLAARCQHARPAGELRLECGGGLSGEQRRSLGTGLRGNCARNREIANRRLRPGKADHRSGAVCLCTAKWQAGRARAGAGRRAGEAARGEGAGGRTAGAAAAARWLRP